MHYIIRKLTPGTWYLLYDGAKEKWVLNPKHASTFHNEQIAKEIAWDLQRRFPLSSVWQIEVV